MAKEPAKTDDKADATPAKAEVATKTVRLPVAVETIVDGKRILIEPGDDVTLPPDEADRLVARFGEFSAPAAGNAPDTGAVRALEMSLAEKDAEIAALRAQIEAAQQKS